MRTQKMSWVMGQLEVVEAGDGPDTLVILHASLARVRSLEPLVDRLARAGWRVRVPALPGYGRSSPPPIGTLGAVAGELVETLLRSPDGATPDGCKALFGHSMGGLAALVAARSGAALDAIALYEPTAFGVLDPSDPDDAVADARDGALAEAALADMAGGDLEAGVARFVAAWGEVAWEAMPEPARHALIALAPTLARDIAFVRGERTPAEAYARVGGAMLLLAGDRSPDAARRMCRRLRAAVPGAELVTIVGAGHMGPITTPEPIADRLIAFLAGVAKRR